MCVPRPVVLGIESSCDDTACAVVDGSGRVLASIVSSQLEAHRPYGGVVPEIASREHLQNWPAVLAATLEQSGLSLAEVDAVAATKGPGLLGSLLVGLSVGKGLAYGLGRPFFAVHHLEGHLVSPYLADDGSAARPRPERFVGLVVSGGHTTIYAVDGPEIEPLVETRDDAMGEVFDKVGKRLGLPYPQGPVVDRLADAGDPTGLTLPVPRARDEEQFFSFSGLKSASIRAIERHEREGVAIDPESLAPQYLDVLASFRVAAVDQILDRLGRLHRRRPIERLAVSGGAAANRRLRLELERWSAEESIELALVPLTYSGDNAAMIAFAAQVRLLRGETSDDLAAEAASRLAI